jgi:hypothetical protein
MTQTHQTSFKCLSFHRSLICKSHCHLIPFDRQLKPLQGNNTPSGEQVNRIDPQRWVHTNFRQSRVVSSGRRGSSRRQRVPKFTVTSVTGVTKSPKSFARNIVSGGFIFCTDWTAYWAAIQSIARSAFCLMQGIVLMALQTYSGSRDEMHVPMRLGVRFWVDSLDGSSCFDCTDPIHGETLFVWGALS